MPIDFAAVQRRLAAAHVDPGAADGKAGPHTYAALLAFVASHSAPGPQTTALAAGMVAHLPAYGIDATPARLGNFLGQACHESGGWQFLREIWGPTTAQQHYEGRADLGNNQPGDGYHFMGRGIFQITGRANYAHMGAAIGLDLIGNPQLAEVPDTAVWTACEFWKMRGLSALADQGSEDAITVRINGGVNGRDERRALVARAKSILGGL
jgi:putative chitinase